MRWCLKEEKIVASPETREGEKQQFHAYVQGSEKGKTNHV